MRKILFGVLLGTLAMYYLDPVAGPDRRRKLSGRWVEQKDTVLDAARNTASTVTGMSQGVGEIVGGRVPDLGGDGESGNGNVLAGSGRPEGGAEV